MDAADECGRNLWLGPLTHTLSRLIFVTFACVFQFCFSFSLHFLPDVLDLSFVVLSCLWISLMYCQKVVVESISLERKKKCEGSGNGLMVRTRAS